MQHKEIYLLFCNNFKWSITYKNTDSLCYTPETNIVNQLYFNKKYSKGNCLSRWFLTPQVLSKTLKLADNSVQNFHLIMNTYYVRMNKITCPEDILIFQIYIFLDNQGKLWNSYPGVLHEIRIVYQWVEPFKKSPQLDSLIVDSWYPFILNTGLNC